MFVVEFRGFQSRAGHFWRDSIETSADEKGKCAGKGRVLPAKAHFRAHSPGLLPSAKRTAKTFLGFGSAGFLAFIFALLLPLTPTRSVWKAGAQAVRFSGSFL
jgi:hypothetical protein